MELKMLFRKILYYRSPCHLHGRRASALLRGVISSTKQDRTELVIINQRQHSTVGEDRSVIPQYFLTTPIFYVNSGTEQMICFRKLLNCPARPPGPENIVPSDSDHRVSYKGINSILVRLLIASQSLVAITNLTNNSNMLL